ncbi:lipid-A-disaccharide synthase [Schleiferia thermophila]|jgi:lipid-A-disaccharide synthase|uniref:Lipid-A-disaccharide synthase n=1 Tax=Schleiferia thermophila TaxID=884107 RepID=A0A369A779_9FLAO|nr:lipid-A-disaccharide synthase [Schleiferia thermophila]KFD38599.1 lipid-A-disaccharide synthase [Schleiferia thermophila str. Yellowstone]RCX05202.1 lipid-A-disaccharide synthase [Schleiferia thermophila]GCD79285.1 lipid-A-disaccharide synthase [Schleiferia thermophila]
MKFLLLAGEPSGDLHGANLLRHLKKFFPDGAFYCFGGDKMAANGAHLLLHYREMAFMGFWEVISNLPKILKNLRFCKNWISKNRPDVVIFIDFPGFNLRVAEFSKKQGCRNIYYISPQIWAWKESRVYQIIRNIDLMITILPFERDFYRKYNYEVKFAGHPLLDALYLDKQSVEKSDADKDIDVVLLPGSRLQEVRHILPVMTEVAVHFPDRKFVVAAAPNLPDEIFQLCIKGKSNVEIIKEKTYELIRRSKAAIVTSGTATLETALLGTPLIVVYKGNSISYWIARQLVKVKYISLINLILDHPAVPELIQYQVTPSKIKEHLSMLLTDPKVVEEQHQNFSRLHKLLGGSGASQRAAIFIKEYITEHGKQV